MGDPVTQQRIVTSDWLDRGLWTGSILALMPGSLLCCFGDIEMLVAGPGCFGNIGTLAAGARVQVKLAAPAQAWCSEVNSSFLDLLVTVLTFRYRNRYVPRAFVWFVPIRLNVMLVLRGASSPIRVYRTRRRLANEQLVLTACMSTLELWMCWCFSELGELTVRHQKRK